LRSKKRFGQHFLQEAWAEKLIAVIDPEVEQRFVEIGPGRGALTLRLAPLVQHLSAVELDPHMVAMLRPQLPANVSLIQADVLDVDVASFEPAPVRVVGNLPYNVSSPILFHLLETYRRTRGFRDATLMLQREVAERVAASPATRDFGVLSILVQLHCDVRVALTLPPGAFRPAPKVHSAVVHFRFRPPAVELADSAVFEAMVRSMFTQRRKMLANALAPFATARHADARTALSRAGIDPSRRPETLQLTELARLADYFASD
jgi:16S rRNA (adenine1518-N6/adenine1519-N6)-dimethyltransferase